MDVRAIYNRLSEGGSITFADRETFGITSIIRLIESISAERNVLFHGTRAQIRYGSLLDLNPLTNPNHAAIRSRILPLGANAAFAANYPTVLIIKALFDNNFSKLDYPYHTITELGIYEVSSNVIHNTGFIYLLNNTSSFQDVPYSPWEKMTRISGATFGGAITVTLDDLPSDLKVVKKIPIPLEELKRVSDLPR